MKNKRAQAIFGNFVMLIIFVVAIFVGGILAAIIQYDMKLVDSSLRSVDFKIPVENNITNDYNITTLQDILGVTLYPVLGISDTLPILTYFMVFAFIIAMAITAYVSSKNAVFFVLHLLFLLVVTYFCFILSNTYIKMLSNPFINSIMINYSIYNKIMIYLPGVVFFTGLAFAAIAFVNVTKPQSNLYNNQSGLNYGGDY